MRFLFLPYFILFMLSYFVTTNSSLARGESNCTCQALECGECEELTGYTFYTEVCNQNGDLKSCKKPKCKSLPPNECTVSTSIHQKLETHPKQLESNLPSKEGKSIDRNRRIGMIEKLDGEALLISPLSRVEAKSESPIYMNQTIVLRPDSQLIFLIDGQNNKIVLKDEAQIRFNQVSINPRQIEIILLMGGLRVMVNDKLDESQGEFFRIRTPNALASVLGTDFYIEYNFEKQSTEVSTFHGKVQLSNSKGTKNTIVKEGMVASYVAGNGENSVFSNQDIDSFIESGHLIPAHRISKDEMKIREESTNFSNRKPSSMRKETVSICKAPSAKFNQCQWVCVNNPKGSKKCRSELSDVKCIRKRCNANGNWADASVLPETNSDMCNPFKPRVSACDY